MEIAGIATSPYPQESSPGVETGRTNCFECFPIRYDSFTGFGQAEESRNAS